MCIKSTVTCRHFLQNWGPNNNKYSFIGTILFPQNMKSHDEILHMCMQLKENPK